MKNISFFIKPLVFVLLIAGLSSCEKEFLEIKPKGKLIAETVSDYDLALSNLKFININTDAQVPLSDEVAAVEPYFSGATLRMQRLFRWEDVIYQPDENAQEMEVPMQNIYAYNKIINEVMDASGGTEQQKKSIRAEAMAGRAWTYFLLINYYGKPYNKATAASDPGFPIVTNADATLTHFTRASVKDVYDFILKDLSTAIPNLPKLTHRVRMSKAAGEGLLGKVYMFMGKFNKALPFLNASISDLSSAGIPTGLYNYNQTFAPNGEFMPIGLFGPNTPTPPNNKENIYAKQFINYWTFSNNELVIRPETADLYEASDLRLNFYSANAFFGGPYPNGILRRIGPTGVQFGVTVPDIYLLRAECKARLNDLPGAVADVETLRKNRMPVADASVPATIATDQEALVKFILEERIREFAVQGYRWFTMRRLSVDPVYSSTINHTHKLYDASGNVIETYTLRPERLVLRFPQKIMEQNPGMKNNP